MNVPVTSHETPTHLLMKSALALLLLGGIALAPDTANATELLTKWLPTPADWKGAAAEETGATLSGEKWSYLHSPEERTDVEVSASLTITEPAKQFRFFGESWSVWPDGKL